MLRKSQPEDRKWGWALSTDEHNLGQ